MYKYELIRIWSRFDDFLNFHRIFLSKNGVLLSLACVLHECILYVGHSQDCPVGHLWPDLL